MKWSPNHCRRGSPFLISVALFLGGVVTRLPFFTSYLYAQDTLRFALSIHHFDVAKEQPHPPGYILFVGLLRLVNGILRDGTATLTLMGALFSALSAVLIFLFAIQLLGDRRTAVFVSLVWLTNPILWYSSEIGEIYPVGAFASLATASCSLLFWKHPSERSAILAAGVFAAGAGLRPDQLVFLAPVMLLPFWYSRLCRRLLPLAATVFFLAYLSWYVPLAESAGGYRSYSNLVRGQFLFSVRTTSIFWGAPIFTHLRMLVALGSWLSVGLLPFWILVPLFFVCKKTRMSGPVLEKQQWLFLFAWAASFMLFFGTMHISKAGYLLPALPPVILLLGRWIVVQVPLGRKGLWPLAISSILAMVINVLYFFAVSRVETPEPPRASGASVSSARLHLLPYLWKSHFRCCVYEEIYVVNKTIMEYFPAIGRIAGEQPTEIVVFQPWAPYPGWLALVYYFPQIPVYGLLRLEPQVTARVGFQYYTGDIARGAAQASGSGQPVSVSLVPGHRALVMIPLIDSDVGVTLPDEELREVSEVTPRVTDPRLRVYRLLLFGRSGDNRLTLRSRFRSVVIRR